ncbi:MmgE/PrpD family protein [Oleispirillum naphthae]|uniref:MmgE/PrpD family protein n=1 Tax=Oleispirillum naphthae TaxID=2838853 RepID=UPI00308226C8
MANPPARLAERLAAFTAALRWQDLPADVRGLAVQAFRDWVANAAAGTTTPFGEAVLAVARAAGGGGRASLIGPLGAADPLTAALVNGGSSHALEFDDSHKGTFYHPGSPACAAALAAAQAASRSGAEMFAGIVAGYEAGIRLAAALGPEHYRVWHTTGTAGVFAAAAAAARTLGLSAGQTAAAFGLAGTQAAGLWEVLPDAPAAKNLHAGKAAQGGLLAALLAREGVPGPASILEGSRGVFAAMVPTGADAEACVAALGETWRIREITFKAYPICGHTMTPVEAALHLRPQVGDAAVERIVVHSNAISLRVVSNPDPHDGYAAKFSMPYCVAAALIHGRVTQAEFAPEALCDARIRDLMGRIALVADPEFDRIARTIRPARMEIHLADGRVLEATSETRRGDPEQPLSVAEISEKFRALAALAWGTEKAARVDAEIDALPGCDSVPAWAERVLSV